MKRLNFETFEVGDVESQYVSNTVNVHGSHQPRVMNLCPYDAVFENKPFPFRIGCRRTGKQNERLLYLCDLSRRLRDGKAEPVLRGGTGAHIPEL